MPYTDTESEDGALPCAGKLAFEERREAQAAAAVAEHRYGGKLRVYRCRNCGLWHLSSAVQE